jgi:methionyl-tRNA synthetase
MLQRYRQGIVPARSDELRASVDTTVRTVADHLRLHDLQHALRAIWALVTRANQYVDQTAPFKLAKDPTQAARLDEVLYNLVEVCRLLAVLLHPFLPDTARRIFSQLNLENTPQELSSATWGSLKPGHSIGKPQPLFPPNDPAPRPGPGSQSA